MDNSELCHVMSPVHEGIFTVRTIHVRILHNNVYIVRNFFGFLSCFRKQDCINICLKLNMNLRDEILFY